MSPLLLGGITKAIVHGGACPDGLASAIIVRDAISGLPVQFISYGTPEHENLPAEPGLLFVDFSPPRARWREFLEAGSVVLDHHKSIGDVVREFAAAGLGAFGDEDVQPGVSGAVLAYEHVWKPLKGQDDLADGRASEFVRLAGIRDTWQKEDPDWNQACCLAEGLRFYADDWERFNFGAGGWDRIHQAAALGAKLVAKHKKACQKAVERAWYAPITAAGGGLRLCVLHSYSAISDAADLVDADVVAAFRYECQHGAPAGGEVQVYMGRLKLHVSLRSRGRVDCGAVAKEYGGGGHRGAAGYTSPFADSSPHITILNQLRAVLE